jgi:hypothetical protein
MLYKFNDAWDQVIEKGQTPNESAIAMGIVKSKPEFAKQAIDLANHIKDTGYFLDMTPNDMVLMVAGVLIGIQAERDHESNREAIMDATLSSNLSGKNGD